MRWNPVQCLKLAVCICLLQIAVCVGDGNGGSGELAGAGRELQSLSALTINSSQSFVTRHNLTQAVAAELQSLLLEATQQCDLERQTSTVAVRLQLDYLYPMLVYAEAAARAFLQAAAGSGSAFLGGTDVRLLLPPPNDEVTSSLLFRSYTAYNGRGDAWVADSTTAPCKKGDCRGTRPVVLITRTINSSSSTSSIVTSNSSSGNGAASGLQMGSVDDMQGLPTDLDTAASPPQLLPGSTDLARPQLLMYYRYDVLAALGHPPPATWADLADWAAAVNGTADADGDGKGDYAVCLDFTSSCKAGYLALAMAASMLQPETQAGSFFEPADMSPLVGTVAFEEALRIIQRLVPYSAPPLPARNGSSSCRAFEPAFALGRCLLTINFDQMRATPAPGAVLTAIKNAWDDVVGATATLPASGSSSSVVAFPFVRGALPAEALGVAPLPGSEVMYDRGLCVMVPCSPANCPNAVNTTCAASKTDPGQRRACFVNRAPLVAGLGYEYSASPDADAAILGRLAVLEATAGTALKHWPEALAGTLLIGSSNGPAFSDAGGGTTVNDTANTGAALGRRPRRLAAAAAHGAALRRALQRPVTAADWTNGTGLVQLGYSATEVRRYLDAYWGSLLGQDGSGGAASPGPPRNVVQELAFRGSSYFTNVFAQAVGWVLLGGLSPANASALAAGDTRTLLGLVASNLTRLSYKYSQDIGWSGSRGSHTPPPAGSSSGLSGSQLAAAIAVPVVVTVVLAAALAAAVVVIVRKRKAGGWGAVAPPGAGPGTTLLLTDIQNSTVLWETLPPDVMDAAIRCHHDVLRGLLQPHGGYESATEGDAFILAFHTAEDAASYAVAAQVMLMEAAWPEAMLTHPDCEVVWVSPQRMNPTASLSYVSRELLSALTRAVQTGAAQAGLTLGGGAGGASGGDDANAAPASSKTLMRWLTRFGTSELRSNSSVARSRRKNRSSSDGGNGGSAGGAADGGGGGGDGQPSMGKMKSGFEASIYGRITQANSFRKGKPVPDSRGGGGLSPAASSPLEAMLAQTGNLHPSGMHLGPLSKCPSDIRSYMENEQEGMPDFPSTPRAATAVAAAAAAGGAGGAPASAAALLAAHNGGAVNGLVEPVRSTSVLLPVLPGGCVTVATLTEALRQGWRKVVPGSQSSGAAGAGAATGAVDFGGAAGGLAASSRSGTLDLSNNVAAAAVAAFGAAGAGGGGGVEGEVQQVPEHLLAFRGMRVRMGLHSGADVSEVSLNKATGRTQYSGTFMTEAKAVCDSAHGGQVVLSPTVFKQLPPGCLAKAAFLVHMGEHTLDDYSIAKRQRQQAAAAAAARRRAEGRPSKPRGGRALGLPDLEHLDSAKESGGGSSGGAEAGEEPGEEGGSAPDESEEPDPIPLYQLLPHRLACRLPFFEPLRSHSYLSLGLPDAPVGRVTVAFMYVIGAQALLAWNAPVATEALTLFQNTVASQLNAADGYVVELVDGLCLAAFRSSADALLWALRCGKQLLAAPWSDELLEHELCEEVSLPLHGEWGAAAGGAGGGGAGGAGGLTEGRLASGSGPSGTGGGGGGGGGTPHFGLSRATAIRFKTLMRGLRLKVGMDTGFVADSINATTGRMAYRGRPMNRAARIASKALAGQVHCSAAVWTSAVDRLGVMARAGGEDELTASSLGLQSLKGVMEKIEVLSVSYKGTALSAEEAAVMARHAPRSSHNSVTATSSSNPTVLSGLASAFSLGPGAASSASITAGAATAASGGSITAALSRGSLLNTVLGGGTASPSARNNRSPHVSGGGGLFGGGSTGGAVGGGGGGSGGSSLLPIGVVAPPSAGAGGAGLLLRGSGMRSGTLPPLVTSAEGGAASPLSRTTGYSPQEAPSSPLLGGASASLGAGAAGDALHKEHIVLHLNPLHDTAAGSAVNSGTHALVDSAPVAGISGSFAGAGQQQAAAAAALAHPGAGSAATAAFLLYGSRRVNHGLGPAPAAPAPAAIGLPPRPQSYGGSGGGGGAGGAGAGSPASEGPSAAELTGGDPGTDSPADSPGAGMPARQAPPPGLNRIITFGATVGAAVVEDLNFLAIPPPPPAGAGGAVSGPVAPVAPAPASDTGMSPSAFATSPPPGALLGLQAASSSSAARRGSTGTQLLPGTDSLVSAAGSAGGDGSSRTSQGREHGIDPAAFLAAQQLSINKRDGPAASGQVEVPLDPLSLQVLLDRIEKQ